MPKGEVRHDPRRDVVTHVPYLPAADLLGRSAPAFGRVQKRGYPPAPPPTGRPAASGRPPTTRVGGSSPHQRPGPDTLHDPSPAAFRHTGTQLRWQADLLK